jgi:Cu/Ag efflux pump CusA
MGFTVIGGMLAATGLAIFLIPAFFALVETFTGKRTGAAPEPPTHPAP